MRGYVRRLLSSQGYEVDAVADGEAALHAARARPPGLVLADVMMPKLDGLGLVRELRNDPETRGVPIILVSARAGEESRVDGFGKGADDYLIKPFSARELLARVSARLELARVRGLAEQELRHARDYAEAIIHTTRGPLVILEADLRVHKANKAFYQTFNVPPAETEGRLIYELGDGQWNIPRLRELLKDVVPRNSFFDDFEVTHDFATIGRRVMLLNARKLSAIDGAPARVLLASRTSPKSCSTRLLCGKARPVIGHSSKPPAEIVWTTDATGAVVDDSPSWRAFTGQTYEQWKGLGWLDALHPEDRERISELWQRAVRERTPVAIAYRLRHVSGEWRWTAVRAVPVLHPDGSVREWVGMNNDITERKEAEEKIRASESRFRGIVQQTNAGIAQTDLTGRFVLVNKRYREIVGRSRQELLQLRMQPRDRSRGLSAISSVSRRILPEVMREISSKSSTMRVRVRVWRASIDWSRVVSRSDVGCCPRISATFEIADNRVRSSCASIPRNSSLRRSASFNASSARLRSVTSMHAASTYCGLLPESRIKETDVLTHTNEPSGRM